MGKVIELSDANFEAEVLNANIPVLIDFWAIWCGPCKAIAPIVEDLAKEYDGKFKFAKMDVDKNRQIATQYGIRSIPTLLVFKDGKVKDTIIGATVKANIVKKLEAVLQP